MYAEYSFVSRGVNEFGIATFSRYPIVDKGRIDFPNSKNNLCIYTDLQIGKDVVRVYNAHFESLHFSADELMEPASRIERAILEHAGIIESKKSLDAKLLLALEGLSEEEKRRLIFDLSKNIKVSENE